MWQKTFSFTVEKRWEAKSQDGQAHHYVNGVASDQSLDRDGDRMSGRAIDQMKKFVEEGMNFYADHAHGLFDMLGVLTKAENRNGHLWVEARLEDPELNPKTKLFLHKLDIGEKIGLSIGGDLRKSHMEGGTRVIDDVVLYEISAVGIPSNANAYLLGSVYKSYTKSGYASLDSMAQVLRDTRSFMQPEGKIAAEPGMSGSSEVFRTDTGQKFEDNPWETASPTSTAKPTDAKTSEYEPGAKLEEDGHMYLPDGSHSKKCDEWDSRAQKAGHAVHPLTKGNVGKFLASDPESPYRQLIWLKKDAYNWPSVIAFDYNGTLDLRGTGKNIGIEELLALRQAGKTVVVFTSSIDADGKEFMRSQLAKHGILYTDDEDILDQVDIFVGDKRSDEKKAGKHGCKFINVEDFDLGKLLSKSLRKEAFYFGPETNKGTEPRDLDTIPGRNKTLPSEFIAPIFNARGVEEKSLEKSGPMPSPWREEFAQTQAQQQQLQSNEVAVRNLEQHRDQQERLHSLGQPHDNTVCRHCTGVQPSALRPQARPDALGWTHIPPKVTKSGATAMRPGGAMGHTEEQLGGGDVGSGAVGLSEEERGKKRKEEAIAALRRKEEAKAAARQDALPPEKEDYEPEMTKRHYAGGLQRMRRPAGSR